MPTPIKYNLNNGDKFGNLTFINECKSINKNGHKIRMANCICNCGNVVMVILKNLVRGNSNSCGCNSSKNGKSKITHGKSKSDLYRIYFGIKYRCYNKKSKAYLMYGGRGIKMCDRWLGDDGFVNFANDVGERPSMGHSIDRYPNKDGDYEPSNVRWATAKEQANNTNSNLLVEINGCIITLSEACEKYLVPVKYISARMKRSGVSFQESVKMYELYKKTNKRVRINKK